MRGLPHVQQCKCTQSWKTPTPYPSEWNAKTQFQPRWTFIIREMLLYGGGSIAFWWALWYYSGYVGEGHIIGKMRTPIQQLNSLKGCSCSWNAGNTILYCSLYMISLKRRRGWIMWFVKMWLSERINVQRGRERCKRVNDHYWECCIFLWTDNMRTIDTHDRIYELWRRIVALLWVRQSGFLSWAFPCMLIFCAFSVLDGLMNLFYQKVSNAPPIGLKCGYLRGSKFSGWWDTPLRDASGSMSIIGKNVSTSESLTPTIESMACAERSLCLESDRADSCLRRFLLCSRSEFSRSSMIARTWSN